MNQKRQNTPSLQDALERAIQGLVTVAKQSEES